MLRKLIVTPLTGERFTKVDGGKKKKEKAGRVAHSSPFLYFIGWGGGVIPLQDGRWCCLFSWH